MIDSTELRVMRSIWAATSRVKVMAGKVDWYRRSLSGMPLTTVDSEGNQSTLTAMAMISR